MKFSIIKKSLLGAALGISLLGVPACKQTTEDVFGSTPNERIDAATQALIKRLADAPEGWLLEYTPGEAMKYGVYNIGLKFSTKGEVLATNELFPSHSSWIKSYFSIGRDKNLSINFDTYNQGLHFFTTPDINIAGGSGKGFEGDHEFNIVEYVSDDVIKLRGKRTGVYMTMRRATQPINDYIGAIKALKNRAYNIDNMGALKQDALVGNVGGKEQLLKLDATGLNVFTVTTKGSPETKVISFIYTITGIKLITPLEGVTDFTWSDANKRYEGPSGETLIARSDPSYPKFAAYFGAYTLATSAGSYDLNFEEDGYNTYKITGLPYELKAYYLPDEDRVEIRSQEIRKTEQGTVHFAAMNGSSLWWGGATGVYLSPVPGTSPQRYTFEDNGAARANPPINGFILWIPDVGRYTGLTPNMFTLNSLTRK